ncbi:transposase [Streptomyces sp. NPDC058145]|uniref:transposase n=1 Tax=Streptomyces sp. NPDC058145 TaxID=3346356 RepID=UPI0036EB6473
MTDAQWARTEPLLPDRSPRRRGRWRDHRQVIDAIAFKYRTLVFRVLPPIGERSLPLEPVLMRSPWRKAQQAA